MIDHTSPVSDLLRAWGQGAAQAHDDLLPLVYAELRTQAARYMRGERRDHTLATEPCALLWPGGGDDADTRARPRRMTLGVTEVQGE